MSTPETIGPYNVEEKIGEGGMGTVYKAVHCETRQVVAIKVLPAALAREEGFRPRFDREIEALSKLKSPNIVELYDSNTNESDDDEPDVFWYAMEFVDGETLTTKLRREEKLPWIEAVQFGQQLCRALKAAHNAGVVHRDLKPSNLLISKDGQLKLTDFGIAQIFASARLTQAGGVIGTAEYMSPEQVKGARATKKSDLYSLGVVLYTMITGRPPFTGKDAADVMQKHLYARFDRPGRIVEEIPVWLDDIICQLLEKDPDKRLPDALVVSNRLEEVKQRAQYAASSGDDRTQIESGDEDSADGKPAGRIDPEPGGATMMRDLMRTELERQQQGGPIARFFNNIFVLVALLGLLIWGGIWWFSRGQTAEDLFKEGTEVIDGRKESEAWVEARDEKLLKILEDESLSKEERQKWSKRIDPYLRKVRLYEFRRQLGLTRGRRKEGVLPINEEERLLIRARQMTQLGNDAAAARLLNQLKVITALVPEQAAYFAMAEEMLTQMTARRDATQRDAFIKRGLKRAHDYATDGQRENAIKVLDSLDQLYGDDSEIAARIKKAREEIPGD